MTNYFAKVFDSCIKNIQTFRQFTNKWQILSRYGHIAICFLGVKYYIKYIKNTHNLCPRMYTLGTFKCRWFNLCV